MNKIIRITTVPQSLKILLKGQLRFINNYLEVIGISTNGKDLELVEKDEGIKTIAVEMTRRITPLKDIKAIWQLYKIFKKEKPEIVHTHTPKAGTVGMIAAKMAGVPHRLHTIAGLPLLVETGKKRKLLDFVEKVTYSCATKIYPNSLGLQKIIIDNKYTKENKIKVIGNGSSNGIDLDFFDPKLFSGKERTELRTSLGIQKEDFVFIFVGRLVKSKGVNELISSFEKLSKKHSDVKLLILGKFEAELDPLEKNTISFIENSPYVKFAGYQTDVRPYFAIADCLVFPSYREGFPNVVLQAGAMGLSSIVSNINGCNEIIKDLENGLIIPVKDEQALYEKMEFFLENPLSVQKMSDKSRSIIEKNFDRAFIWEELLKEYKFLLNK